MLYSSPFRVLAVTETWLFSSVLEGEIFHSRFAIFHCNRPTRGGGVLVAVRHSLFGYKLSTPSHLKTVCAVVGPESSIMICVDYVPPNSSYDV